MVIPLSDGSVQSEIVTCKSDHESERRTLTFKIDWKIWGEVGLRTFLVAAQNSKPKFKPEGGI